MCVYIYIYVIYIYIYIYTYAHTHIRLPVSGRDAEEGRREQGHNTSY